MPERAASAFRTALEKNERLPRGTFLRFHREVAAAIAAEPYDRNKLATLLNEHRQRLDTFQEGVQAGLLAAIDAMTPEQRQDYARDMLRRGPPGPPPRPGRDLPPLPPGDHPPSDRGPMDGGPMGDRPMDGDRLPPPPR
jgi:hypothetical protein